MYVIYDVILENPRLEVLKILVFNNKKQCTYFTQKFKFILIYFKIFFNCKYKSK